ncbi:aquaporin NIP1-1-like [Pyrus ussuriensis x Pyrus communis]|uniref:Aquaporin NIP1-1-like n=1 Tax=Pyrus ussuriensis x Pyrus communis TaxID=2448454 RepID=A0A5N5GNC4_9ROSA|nr:aquaporin NIP1-1-like [Pyrus ussuriensis x Pyrus communis]
MFFSISSPKLVLSIGHTTMQEAGANSKLTKADISTSIFQKMMAELGGTYIVIFIGCGAALVNKVQPLTVVGIAIVWGLVFMATVYAVGHVSGAHFNPAVTIALAAGRRFPVKHVPIYVMSQLSGATLASLTLRLLLGNSSSRLYCCSPFVGKNLPGIAIGGAVLVNVMIAGPITRASLNPARSFGPAAVTSPYKNIWVYIAAPILGAIAATVVYSVLRVPKPVKSDEKADPILARNPSQV